ncbi:hypothetical protein NBO_34g0026 [Nosema bombycis CQ1]|uniref:Uncharacterized protein n=1 Tax=Nosema bombycis (strain CQ1 / CVCC 102059) TaxID=578461 RepID=R0KTN1_NOSB1|nr:hypothetical protein NBO_34g0026 [Nosema bombycis CQ1]|eukprot:EOB14176.1 hypothetical protein NBO_34g0026 [Nosema bombycis CQ1]
MTISQIDKELKKSDFKSQEDLDSHVNHVLSLINSYEQDLYDKEEYDKSQRIQIRKWRQILFNLQNQQLDEVPEILESTARIINRQINKMDANTGLLYKGTLN